MSEIRIGVINGGGDAPGLNAAISALVRAGTGKFTAIGFRDGFEGMCNGGDTIPLNVQTVHGIMQHGGTILGTRSSGPFSAKIANGEVREIEQSLIEDCLKTSQELGLEGLVVLGGDGTFMVAEQFARAGLPFIGLPKTIDNDLAETDKTFGFETAVEYVKDALDRLRDTMTAHRRVMIVEVMGRSAGFIALHGGVAGGADMILLPEIPFSWSSVMKAAVGDSPERRRPYLIVVAEGAFPQGEEILYRTKTHGDTGEWRRGGIAQNIADRLQEKFPSLEARAVVLGHVQRGGSPIASDRILAIQLGVMAAHLVTEKAWGYFPAVREGKIIAIPVAHALHDPKKVHPQHSLLQSARACGVLFGDE